MTGEMIDGGIVTGVTDFVIAHNRIPGDAGVGQGRHGIFKCQEGIPAVDTARIGLIPPKHHK